LSGIRAFTITVKDHDGSVKQGARITIRDGETYAIAHQVVTNAYGQATVNLTDWAWYVVTVVAPDHGVDEFWYYNYILPADWTDADGPAKVMQRKDPWIAAVDMPTASVPVGAEQQFAVTIQHNHDATNYDLKVIVRMWVDDDGLEPYLFAGVSAQQNFYAGIHPFVIPYTPTAEGTFLVRFRVDRQFENNPWYVADEGGWEWSLQVGEPEPTPTPAPCRVSGRVFEDVDRDGAYGAGDLAVPRAEVLLCDAGGAVVDTRQTDAQGRYAFADLPAGSYLLGLGALPGHYGRPTGTVELVCAPGEDRQNTDFYLWRWTVNLPCIEKH
jgi:hypothetical protein